MQPDSHDPAIVALVADLMFASRVRGVAGEARTVSSTGALDGLVGEGTRLVLIDLQVPGAAEAVRALKARDGVSATVVAFGSHVDTEALEAARLAGADRVMPRSAFVRELPGLVEAAREG